MPQDIERAVVETVARRKSLDPSAVSLDATFGELGIDSLTGIEIMFALEEQFDINIPDDAAREVKTLRDVVRALQELGLGARTGGA
jgi:acyl carrier protein